MFSEIYRSFGDPHLTAEWAVKSQQLMAQQWQQWITLQTQLAQSYAALGIQQAETALAIRDIASLYAYITQYTVLAEPIRQKWMNDAKAIANLSVGFKEQWDKLIQDQLVVFLPPPLDFNRMRT